MIKVSVIYPNDAGNTFDWNYYVDKHMAMVRQKLGGALLRSEIDEGIGGAAPGSAAHFVAAVHMYFDSLEAFGAAFGPHAKEILGDVPNYTNVKPVTQISKPR